MFVKDAINSPYLNWADSLTDGTNVKIISATPLVSTVVSLIKHKRLIHSTEKGLPRFELSRRWSDMQKFTTTVKTWGCLQVAAALVASVACLLFALMGAAIPVAGPALALGSLLLGAGCFAFAAATAFSHEVSKKYFSINFSQVNTVTHTTFPFTPSMSLQRELFKT